MSLIATCFIVPLSLNTTLSASATVVDVALVSPSRILSSAAVEVTPSSMFNSAAVEVIAVPLIANFPVTTLNVALSSILATSVPSYCWNIISLESTVGLIITSLELFPISNICVPLTENLKFPPAASKLISPATSTNKSPEDRAIVVPSILKLSISIPASAVILPADTVVPLISKLPLTSIRVAFNSISSVALISSTVALGALIYCDASLNCNCIVLFKRIPVSAT